MTGPAVTGRFNLIDHHGERVSELTYRGRWLLVFFGFTNCRMVCPRALGRLSAAIDLLGDRADRVQPLYITVDPERDRPDVMRSFLSHDYPRFVGLTGSPAEIEAARAAFRVFATRTADPDDPSGYAMPHTAITYLLDPHGALTDHFDDSEETSVIVTRLLDRIE